MKLNKKGILLLVLCGIVFYACNINKRISDKSNELISKEIILNNINSLNNIEDLIVIKGSKVTIEDNETVTNFKVNLMIKLDSAILVSVSTLLGIEVSRALILKDSIKVIDRINKSYYKEKYEELEQRFAITLDFYQIQNSLIANFGEDIKNYVDTINSLVTDKGGKVIIKNKKQYKEKELNTNLELNTRSFQINNCKIDNNKSDQRYLIEYSNYFKVGNYFFPGFIDIDFINKRNEIRIAIQHKNIKLQPDNSIDFKIPVNYYRSR